MNRRTTALTTALLMSAPLILAGCGAVGGSDAVGVAMPTRTSDRWVIEGEAMQERFDEAGYDVDLQYAGDDIGSFRQADQIDAMIDDGVELLIIGAVDGAGLDEQLARASEEGIPVIAYDRLLLGTQDVDHYVTFDNYGVGVAQARALLHGLGVTDKAGEPTGDDGPYDVELFAGSLDDNNAVLFWEGAMDTLQPYLDDGTLDVPSGQVDIEEAETYRWEQETARDRMGDLLTQYYDDATELDGVLSPYDGISRGVITAVRLLGSGESAGDDVPVVTGQDAEIDSVRLIRSKVQHSTVFKDNRDLADQAVEAALAYLDGGEPEVNDTTTYDNGAKVVPTYLLDVQTVYRGDIDEVLVASGFIDEEDLEVE